MDGLNMLFQDWVGILVSVMGVLGLAAMWLVVVSKGIVDKHGQPKPNGTSWVIGAIVVSFVVVGLITLIWGGRAYLLAHRTEADNVHAEARAERVQNAREINYDLDEIRRKREETERQRRLEEDREKNKAARESSEDYFESLKGKGDK